jgi:hypothetical protein
MNRAGFAVLALALAACGGDEGPTSTRVDLGDPGEVGLTPDGATGNGIRPRRRMDVDQLTASIQRVTGGIGWFRGWDGRDYFDVYAQTLGKPNYTDLTAEDLTPSLLFQKFLDDASREVCDDLVDREEDLAAADRILWTSEDLRESLRAALLRWHGTSVRADSPRIDPWVTLYETSAAAVPDDPMEGWRAVCVGLFLHPDFYSY